MSNRIHGTDHSAADELLSEPIRKPGVVKRLADYIKHLCEVDQQSNESNLASQPVKSHVCERNPHRNCNCARGVCADDDATYRLATGLRPNECASDLYTCPVSGSICLGIKCREWCESGVDRSKT